ncbi:unnamed protein product [Rotaria sp. Silwood2]|nr:unnamed protein product [Rotaria sp. Silwood2]
MVYLSLQVNDLGDIRFNRVKFSYPCQPILIILFDHMNIKELNINSFRSHMSLLGQQPILCSMSIAENIQYELQNFTFDQIINTAKKANTHNFLQQLPQIVQQAIETIQIENPLQIAITIAHRLSTLRSCHQIYAIDQGHIIESGSHEELIQRHSRCYQMFLLNSLQ